MHHVRQATATSVLWGPLVSVDPDQTPVTRVSLEAGDVQLIANGADTGIDLATRAIDHVGQGLYAVGLTAADTASVGQLTIVGYQRTAFRPCRGSFMVLGAAAFDRLYGTDSSTGPAADPPVMTFRQCAEGLLAAKDWRDLPNRRNWHSTLASYAYPVLATMPVQEVGTEAILQVIEPIWARSPALGNRLRARIAAVLAWASAHGFRNGPNPADWRWHLDRALPAPRMLRRPVPAGALPYRELPAFLTALRQHPRPEARALEFMIITNSRVIDIIQGRWSEIDRAAQLWTIPADRRPYREALRIPLADRALAILREMGAMPPIARVRIFLGRDGAGLLRRATLPDLLGGAREHGRVTPSGFRITFVRWATECTGCDQDTIELCCGHRVAQATELIYRRDDLLDRRRALMSQWARFCGGEATAGDRAGQAGDAQPLGRKSRATVGRSYWRPWIAGIDRRR